MKMAIKDGWSRILRKSVSSSSTSSSSGGGQAEVTPSHDLSKTPTRLARWRSANKSSNKNKKNAEPEAERQTEQQGVTEAEIRHQQLLDAFTMTFGRRKASGTSYGGVSPGGSRHGSLDAGHVRAQGHSARRVGSMSGEVPREMEGEAS